MFQYHLIYGLIRLSVSKVNHTDKLWRVIHVTSSVRTGITRLGSVTTDRKNGLTTVTKLAVVTGSWSVSTGPSRMLSVQVSYGSVARDWVLNSREFVDRVYCTYGQANTPIISKRGHVRHNNSWDSLGNFKQCFLVSENEFKINYIIER